MKKGFTPLEISSTNRITKFLTGFTLLELLIAIVVITILASIAIPAYIKTVEKSKAEAAILNLKTIRMGEWIWRVDHGEYTNADLDMINDKVNGLKLDLEDVYYTYSVSGATANAFTATAQRNSGAPAGYANTTITLTVTITVDPSTGVETETITWGGTSPFVP